METMGGPNHGSGNNGDEDHGGFLLFNLGLDYFKSAEKLENGGKLEAAYKYYKEAANKFMFLIKSEANPQKQKDLKEMLQKAIDHGLWMKTLIDDKKKAMKSG